MKSKQILANTLPGPDDITRMELPNGVTVLTRSNFNSPSVVVSGYLKTGSLMDSDEKLGLAHFATLALMRGTRERDFQTIYDTLESAGASLGFSAGVNTTSFNGRALVEDLPMLLTLIAEALQFPAFPAVQVERLRAQLLTGLAIRAQDTGYMASMAFDEIVYQNHPYRRPEDGYVETIQAINVADLEEYHHRCFGPQQMVIVITGDIEPARAVDLAGMVLGAWENPAQPSMPALPPLTPLTSTIRRHVPIAGKSQTDLVLGTSGPSRVSPDFIAASLGNSILGQFGMMGRIGDSVRDRSGLAYYAYASLNSGIGPGTWEVSAGINPANLEKTIQLVQQELLRFTSEPVSAEELDDSQSNYIGRLPLSLESNAGVASALLNLERYNLGLDYYRRYAGLVRQVTPAMILETAQRYLSLDRLAIASAGPE
jgi:zinc protease